MELNYEASSLVRQLKAVGIRPPEALVERILALGDAAVAPLIELATDAPLLKAQAEGNPLVGPLHALRLLGELRPQAMVEPLIAMFPLDEEYNFRSTLLVGWIEEVPQMIARVGPAVEQQLWAVVEDAEQHPGRRDIGLTALANLAEVEPARRDAIVARLRALLATEQQRSVGGSLVSALCLLNVAEAYKDVMAAFRERRVDTEIINPGTARQLLLSRRRPEDHACVLHTLWERYDQHGPTRADAEPDELED